MFKFVVSIALGGLLFAAGCSGGSNSSTIVLTPALLQTAAMPTVNPATQFSISAQDARAKLTIQTLQFTGQYLVMKVEVEPLGAAFDGQQLRCCTQIKDQSGATYKGIGLGPGNIAAGRRGTYDIGFTGVPSDAVLSSFQGATGSDAFGPIALAVSLPSIRVADLR